MHGTISSEHPGRARAADGSGCAVASPFGHDAHRGLLVGMVASISEDVLGPALRAKLHRGRRRSRLSCGQHWWPQARDGRDGVRVSARPDAPLASRRMLRAEVRRLGGRETRLVMRPPRSSSWGDWRSLFDGIGIKRYVAIKHPVRAAQSKPDHAGAPSLGGVGARAGRGA